MSLDDETITLGDNVLNHRAKLPPGIKRCNDFFYDCSYLTLE